MYYLCTFMGLIPAKYVSMYKSNIFFTKIVTIVTNIRLSFGKNLETIIQLNSIKN